MSRSHTRRRTRKTKVTYYVHDGSERLDALAVLLKPKPWPPRTDRKLKADLNTQKADDASRHIA